jgi:rod shape determining protein RodA
MKGTQGQYKFLPVAHNDFIFSVLAEEWGFLGVLGALHLALEDSDRMVREAATVALGSLQGFG